jgi:phage-related protein
MPEIVVRGRGDFGRLQRDIQGVGGRFKSMTSGVAAAGRKIAGGMAVGAVGVAARGVPARKAATDAPPSLGATETVFGKYADVVIKRSNEAANALGLSANEYRELSNVTGALLQGAGMPLKKVTGLTGDLNKMAADMAATFGGTTREAVEAVSSLLKGEADPIERYGVSIKESDVTARLAAKGLDKLTGAGLKQAQMTARLELLQQKTAKTRGAFARESGTLANQQQKLTAQIENLKAKIGTALLPVLTRVATFVNAKVIPAVTKFATSMSGKLGPVIDKIKTAFGDLMTRLQPVTEWLRDNPAAVKGAAIALGVAAVGALALAGAMGVLAIATSPITLTVLAIAALGAGIALAYQKSETFRSAVDQVGQTIQTRVLPALQRFGQYVVTVVVPAAVRLAQEIGARLRPILEQVGATFQNRIVPTAQKVVAKFREMWPEIQRVGTFVVKAYVEFVKFAAGVAGKVIPVVIRFAGFVISKVVPAVVSAIGVLVRIADRAIKFGTAIYRAGQDAVAFARKVKAKIDEVVSVVSGLPGRAKSALGDLGNYLYQAGET